MGYSLHTSSTPMSSLARGSIRVAPGTTPGMTRRFVVRLSSTASHDLPPITVDRQPACPVPHLAVGRRNRAAAPSRRETGECLTAGTQVLAGAARGSARNGNGPVRRSGRRNARHGATEPPGAILPRTPGAEPRRPGQRISAGSRKTNGGPSASTDSRGHRTRRPKLHATTSDRREPGRRPTNRLRRPRMVTHRLAHRRSAGNGGPAWSPPAPGTGNRPLCPIFRAQPLPPVECAAQAGVS